MTQQATEPDGGGEGLADLVIARYGLVLDDGQRTLLVEQIERQRVAAAALDAFPLLNADEPDSAFAVLNGEDDA